LIIRISQFYTLKTPILNKFQNVFHSVKILVIFLLQRTYADFIAKLNITENIAQLYNDTFSLTVSYLLYKMLITFTMKASYVCILISS